MEQFGINSCTGYHLNSCNVTISVLAMEPVTKVQCLNFDCVYKKSSNDFHEALVQMGDPHLNLALLLAWLSKFATLALIDQHFTTLSMWLYKLHVHWTSVLR